MASNLQIQLTLTSNGEMGAKTASGFVTTSSIDELREFLNDRRFLELRNKDGKTTQWVNLDQVSEVRVRSGKSGGARVIR